ncbi:hypothetical protein N7493_009546 [Penicillium malachiteum]|uniref:Uncharacterized protein n=1 Tax=Penicillium malachiteum TaxID=1324776 RepID=A0AAD6HEA5_9EURO|nr:hypothetical protein N7493_009546 [Penicillium malachiteum]
MRVFQTVSVVLFSTAAVVLTADASYNFRPDNVTLSDLYKWVGSYYNGTTNVEFAPYAGLAASETEYCPVLRNQTITTSYPSVLSLTEPASYNSDDDVVNAFLTLWPNGFNFSSIASDTIIWLEPSLEYALFSSEPVYENDEGEGFDNFLWSLEETSAPPYNLSSTLTNYEGWNPFTVKHTVNCGGNIVHSWLFAPMSFEPRLNGTDFPNLVVDVQFDSTTTNMTMKGYFFADVESEILGSDLESWYGNVFAGSCIFLLID